MEFWTAHTLFGPAMLCDRCALFAVNSASFDFIRRPFGSMEEAMEFFAVKCAEAGLDPFAMTSSDVGVCGHCGEDNFEVVVEAS